MTVKRSGKVKISITLSRDVHEALLMLEKKKRIGNISHGINLAVSEYYLPQLKEMGIKLD
jgi:hypothetical protein